MAIDLRDALDVPAVAGRLGVSSSEARRLIRDEQLLARQVAGRWVVPDVEVRRFASLDRPVGRPLAQRSVWVLLRMIEEPGWRSSSLSPSRQSQLKRLLRDSAPGHLAAMARNRARRNLYWVHPSLEDDLLDDVRVHRSGWSALSELDVGLVAGGDVPIEMYVRADDLVDVRSAFQLEPADSVVNLIAHVIDDDVVRDDLVWERIMRPASALDLIESGDPRARNVGRELWERLVESARHG